MTSQNSSYFIDNWGNFYCKATKGYIFFFKIREIYLSVSNRLDVNYDEFFLMNLQIKMNRENWNRTELILFCLYKTYTLSFPHTFSSFNLKSQVQHYLVKWFIMSNIPCPTLIVVSPYNLGISKTSLHKKFTKFMCSFWRVSLCLSRQDTCMYSLGNSTLV